MRQVPVPGENRESAPNVKKRCSTQGRNFFLAAQVLNLARDREMRLQQTARPNANGIVLAYLFWRGETVASPGSPQARTSKFPPTRAWVSAESESGRDPRPHFFLHLGQGEILVRGQDRSD